MDELEKLMATLKRGGIEDRAKAVEGFIAIGDPAVPILSEVFRSEHYRLRRWVAAILTKMDCGKARSALKTLLYDKDWMVRAYAAEALLKRSEELSADENVLCLLILDRIEQLGEDAGPSLISALKDPHEFVRAKAIEVIAGFTTNCLPEVVSTLREHVKEVRANGDQEETRKAEKNAAATYRGLAEAIAERKRQGLEGVLSSGTVPKPSGKKIYRAGRVRVVA